MSTDTKAPAAPATGKAVVKIDPRDYDRPATGGVTALQRLAQPLLPQLMTALPKFMAGNAERMLRCLYTECQKTPKLLDCTPKSLFGGVIQVAQLGLELGGPMGQAYLLPFKGEATLCIGYKGFITLAFRAGVMNFTPRVVREGDTCQIEYGTRQELRHVPAPTADGAVIGYYAVVKTPTGGTDFEYLTVAQAQAHKARYALSKNGGPWVTNFDEMAQKTAIRKLAKRVPLSTEWVAAASLDEMADEGVPQQLSAAVVVGEGAEPPSLRERLASAKEPVKAEGVEKDEHGNPIFGGDAPAGALFGNTTGEAPKH